MYQLSGFIRSHKDNASFWCPLPTLKHLHSRLQEAELLSAHSEKKHIVLLFRRGVFEPHCFREINAIFTLERKRDSLNNPSHNDSRSGYTRKMSGIYYNTTNCLYNHSMRNANERSREVQDMNPEHHARSYISKRSSGGKKSCQQDPKLY
jgi:hypothetical protein